MHLMHACNPAASMAAHKALHSHASVQGPYNQLDPALLVQSP